MAEALASPSTLSPSTEMDSHPDAASSVQNGGPQPSAEAAALAWNVLLLLPYLPKSLLFVPGSTQMSPPMSTCPQQYLLLFPLSLSRLNHLPPPVTAT